MGASPSELGNLSALEVLKLNSNQLSGNITPELGNLSSLKELNLCNNNLSGNIPRELGNLSYLDWLYLNDNQLSGSIPSELGNLSYLFRLILDDNRLSGSIPSELGNLSYLAYMYLNSNMLSGRIPPELLNCVSLDTYGSDLRWNAFFTNMEMMKIFLDRIQIGGDCESTQTIAPDDLTTGKVTPSSIQLSWTPITYTSDTGGYEAFHSVTSGGPYTFLDITVDKTISSMNIIGLNQATMYYFVVQTVTYPHTHNQNTVCSEPSIEVVETTSLGVPTLNSLCIALLLIGISIVLFRSHPHPFQNDKSTLAILLIVNR